jgi:outer membrane protein assembly factor BamB/thioredoxin-like negative regulator of GroEL
VKRGDFHLGARLSQPYAFLRVLILFCLLSFSLQSSEDFEKTSLTLRTALHYDPSVEVPLTKLVELYRTAGRSEELLGLYSAHLTQYPDDASAKLVLARLYMELKDRRAAEFLKSAVTQHPDHALLAWQQARFLQGQFDSKSVEEMARAVSLEKSPARRALWFTELMKTASVQSREDLVLTQTKDLLKSAALNPEQRLRWARQALSTKLTNTAQSMLEGLQAGSFGTDSAVEFSLVQAEVAAAQGKPADAVLLIDDLLSKLAPEHWRRREILMLRFDLAGNGEEREKLLKISRDKWSQPDGKTEAQALTLADLLEATHRTSEAVALLHEAAQILPHSTVIEARLLDLWEKGGLNQDALTFLDGLIKKQTERGDLQLREVRWLYSTNETKRAQEGFVILLKTLPQAQQVERSVEMARWLRRRNQLGDASTLLETALQTSPERWDLRRELGELYFAQRRRDEATKLFAGEWSRDLSTDARLEVAQFLMTKQLWLESRQLIEPWLKAQPAAFEGHLLMAKIEDKLGNEAQVEVIFETARALCDTEARYQGWLESVLQYAEDHEQLSVWLEREAARLMPADKEAWKPELLTRWLTLLEQAKSRDETEVAEKWLALGMTNHQMPPDQLLALEKLKLELLSSDATRALDVQNGLKEMMEKDALHKEDYRLRLALLYQQSERHDLAYEILQQMDPSQATEVSTLRSIMSACQERSLNAQALACAERLTRLEPVERQHWAQWLNLLAQEGQEDRFRVAIREVIGRAHDWKLKDEVLEELRTHLVASQWRTVLIEISSGEDHWASARRAAADMRSLELNPAQRSWVDWLVGYLSLKLKDDPAVSSALHSFAKRDEKQWVVFPDGLELSVKEATASLRKPVSPAAVVSSDNTSPLPSFSMRWGFALESSRMILKVVASEDQSAVFFCDNLQTIYALDQRTGKLLWSGAVGAPRDGSMPKAASRRSPRAVMPVSGMRNYSGQQEIVMPVEMVTSPENFVYLNGSQVVCVKPTTGDLLWQSDLGSGQAPVTPFQTQARLALAGDKVLVWQPANEQASALSLRTGKLLWQTAVPAPPMPQPNAYGGWNGYDAYAKLKSGLGVQGDRVLVYSRTAALLNLEDGAMRWRLTTGEVPGFPLDLSTAEDSGMPAIVTPQRMMLTKLGSGGPLMLSGGNVYFNGRGASPGTQRWAYGNPMRMGLESYYAAHMMMREDEVWVVGGNGAASVSVMGMPLAQPAFNGTVIGFAGGSLVAQYGAMVNLVNAGAEVPVRPIFPDWQPQGGMNLPTDTVSVAIDNKRVYACNGERLRAADARSGATLFDVPMPEELKDWIKSLGKTKPAVATPAMPGRYARTDVNRRNLLPQGVLIQDDRGGGALSANLATVSGGYWIFPVSPHAVACVSGQKLEANPQTASAP